MLAAENIINLKVPQNFEGNKEIFENPSRTFSDFCIQKSIKGSSIGMMTSASMNSYRETRRDFDGGHIGVLLTAGLSNARSAGDSAEYRIIGDAPYETGTINIIALTDVCLSPAAMTEAVMIVTEAKAYLLGKEGIKSAVSGETATGTGTDSTAVACNPESPVKVSFCGKHVLFGELLASAVIEALSDSLAGWKSPV
jgi:adenosylcobinamide amidohydrolase